MINCVKQIEGYSHPSGVAFSLPCRHLGAEMGLSAASTRVRRNNVLGPDAPYQLMIPLRTA
jgi:hypothetical protein